MSVPVEYVVPRILYKEDSTLHTWESFQATHTFFALQMDKLGFDCLFRTGVYQKLGSRENFRIVDTNRKEEYEKIVKERRANADFVVDDG